MTCIKIIVFILVVLFFTTAQQVSAHVLKTDGSVGAVIHVSPEDDPIAREATDFYFEFKDKEGKFTPENCDCKGTIIEGGKEIYSAPLFQNSSDPSLENASFSFTFPRKNVYKVQVSGTPTTPGAFEPFTLSWDIRVARESETQPASNEQQPSDTSTNGTESWISQNLVRVIGLLLVVLSLAYFMGKQFTKKSRSQK